MTFKDLKIGDKFYMILNGVVTCEYVKTRYDYDKRPLRYREHNALRLNDGVFVVIGQNVSVVKI